MNKQEIFNLLVAMPQFVEPDSIELPNNEELDSSWLRLYDITSYKWISINDNELEYVFAGGSWFTLADEDLDKYIDKQQIKAAELSNKIVEVKYLKDDELMGRLENVSHLHLGMIAQEGVTFPEDWLYFVNSNNGGILSMHLPTESLSISNGEVVGYFEDKDSILKILEAEEAFSAKNPELKKVVNLERVIDDIKHSPESVEKIEKKNDDDTIPPSDSPPKTKLNLKGSF